MEQQVRGFFESGLSLLKPSLAPHVNEYSWDTCKKDLASGLTVAAILIPNALGYAILAGLPPVMGLYAAIPAIMCAALWGSSSHVITGPVGIVSLLAAASLVEYATPLTPEYITLAIALAFLAGLIQLSLGLFRLGILARLIPHSALVGFTNAAAVLIAITQLPVLLGLPPLTHSGVHSLIDIGTQLQNIHTLSLVLGGTTIVLIVTLRRTFPAVPGSLIALVGGLVLTSFTDLESLGVVPIGYIPSGIPQFTFAAFSIPVMYLLFKQALLIALVGFVETYSIAQSIATPPVRMSLKKSLGSARRSYGYGVKSRWQRSASGRAAPILPHGAPVPAARVRPQPCGAPKPVIIRCIAADATASRRRQPRKTGLKLRFSYPSGIVTWTVFVHFGTSNSSWHTERVRAVHGSTSDAMGHQNGARTGLLRVRRA